MLRLRVQLRAGRGVTHSPLDGCADCEAWVLDLVDRTRADQGLPEVVPASSLRQVAELIHTTREAQTKREAA